MEFPIKERETREHWIALREECPECGDSLDTGWECIGCGFDALPEMKRSPEWKGTPTPGEEGGWDA